MKKIFLVFATATLLVGVQACKQKEEATGTTEVPEAATPIVDTPAVTPEVGGRHGLPPVDEPKDDDRDVKTPPPVAK